MANVDYCFQIVGTAGRYSARPNRRSHGFRRTRFSRVDRLAVRCEVLAEVVVERGAKADMAGVHVKRSLLSVRFACAILKQRTAQRAVLLSGGEEVLADRFQIVPPERRRYVAELDRFQGLRFDGPTRHGVAVLDRRLLPYTTIGGLIYRQLT